MIEGASRRPAEHEPKPHQRELEIGLPIFAVEIVDEGGADEPVPRPSTSSDREGMGAGTGPLV
jgi:hypothetical protein